MGFTEKEAEKAEEAEEAKEAEEAEEEAAKDCQTIGGLKMLSLSIHTAHHCGETL
jgi:hypothetical protein